MKNIYILAAILYRKYLHLKNGVIDHTLPFSTYKAPPLPAANDIYIADVLKIAEQRCLNLEEEIKQIRNSKTDSENRIKYVRKQKEIVEAENDRLRAQLTGGRPEAAISIESASRLGIWKKKEFFCRFFRTGDNFLFF